MLQAKKIADVDHVGQAAQRNLADKRRQPQDDLRTLVPQYFKLIVLVVQG